jgi:tetratricopeptide (TPR) repeat protein
LIAPSSSAHQQWLAGEAAASRKDWIQARNAYRRALEIDPGHVPSLLGLTNAFGRLGEHQHAHEAAMRAYACRPQHPALIFGLAQHLRYFHEFEALVTCLAQPRFAAEAPVLILAKAVVMLSSIGAHAAAVEMAQRALKREPAHAPSLYVRGNLHFFDGQLDDAERCYEAALRADPRLLQSSWMLASVGTQTAQSNHVERLQRQLADAQPGGDGETYVAYALHKELHDLGDHDAAWRALSRGCAIKRKHADYAPKEDAELVDAMIRSCTADFVNAGSTVQQSAIPIFIVGMHRSGTTLLERMLAGHSQVGDAGETSSFEAQMQLATDHVAHAKPDLELVRRAMDADYDAVARGYANSARWLSRGKPLFTEKLPMNFWNVGYIAKALPQARILHLVRDPMDTCFSNLRTLFSGVATYSYDQTELGGFYLQYRRMMAHWHEIMPGRVLDVAYDELVSNPDTVAARVAAYCGLDYEASIVDVGRSAGSVATASAGLARQGIRKDRGAQWRPYEQYLQPLRDVLAPIYKEGP